MGARAEALASRIEQGAANLAAYVEKLSEAEWKTPINPVRDGRPVNVVVHHVASVYPVEIQLAQAIGSGKSMSDVTWDVVKNMNAGHAGENANVSSADALALLKKNSSEAAAAVRQMTDEQLDTAAPFGLSFDAPVTAQFVIEDHALRHSWHHLARIKETLGK
ncbi:MAG TPA: DinB family protein [Gemmatimonadaceae bacterium]|nr:DinB family protein [Gemmatimonadaceae bacterium]